MDYLIYFLKGLFIGGTMLIPGVSGGTMAMALGLYGKLISSVANIKNKFKDGIAVLLPVALGGLLGAILLSSPIETLKTSFMLPTMYFFVGSIAGSVPMILKNAFSKSESKKFSIKDAVYIVIGIAVPVCIHILQFTFEKSSALSEQTGIVGILVGLVIGGICAISLSLPGISTSYMLLLLGVYDRVLNAFSKLDILYLLPMAVGALIGLFLFSKFMEKQLKYHPRASYTLILGFIIGSVLLVFPYTLPSGFEWIICPLLFALSFIAMYMLSRKQK